MRTVHVNIPGRSYEIIIQGGLISSAGRFACKLLNRSSDRHLKAAIITDENVARLYLSTVERSLCDAGFDTLSITVPAGEQSKCLSEAEKIYERLILGHHERGDPLIALGGGVVGDLAGFIAATYLRGVPYLQIPTTLLAQVDSSVGGKVAVNHSLGKNLIGAFYQPSLVLTDVDTLQTLSRYELLSGLGEIVKHAMIRDEKLFVSLENQIDSILSNGLPAEQWEALIEANCCIKAGVVARDEREAGERAILNYGHTVGHALEALSGYGIYSHGAAVLLGMTAVGEIARCRNMFRVQDQKRQDALIRKIIRGIQHPEFSIEDIPRKMMLDKKVKDGKIRFILPERIGKVRIISGVSPLEIKHGLDHMMAMTADSSEPNF